MPWVLAVALLAGCASGPPRVQHEEKLDRYLSYAGEPVDRANSFRLDSWELVDRDKIVLWTGVNEAYLVTVYDTCRDLEYTNHIRVVSSMGSSISKFDKVKVGRDTCPIREIRPIDVKRMKADMAAERAQHKANQQEP
jgi:outer membrane murein-binding lipoprotein Lpp